MGTIISYSVLAYSAIVSSFFLYLLVTRRRDIRRLKLWGLEAELQEKIDRATATLEELHQLAKVLAEPVITDLAMHGVLFRQLNFAYRCQLKEKIEQNLKEIGLDHTEIDVVNRFWNKHVSDGLAFLVLREINNKDLKPYIDQLLEGPASPADMRDFLVKNDLMNNEREERLKDYEHFLNTKKVRRPETWPIGFQGGR